MGIAIKTKETMKLDELGRLIFEKYIQTSPWLKEKLSELQFNGFWHEIYMGPNKPADIAFDVTCPDPHNVYRIDFQVRGKVDGRFLNDKLDNPETKVNIFEIFYLPNYFDEIEFNRAIEEIKKEYGG